MLPLDHAENGLGVGPLVIVAHVLFPVQAELVVHFLEDAADPAGRIRLERSVKRAAKIVNQLEIVVARIRIVRRHFVHGEASRRCLDQSRELWRVTGVLVENLSGRNDMGRNAADHVDLDPVCFDTFHAILDVEPAVEFARAEPG